MIHFETKIQTKVDGYKHIFSSEGALCLFSKLLKSLENKVLVESRELFERACGILHISTTGIFSCSIFKSFLTESKKDLSGNRPSTGKQN
ncbi:MAG: hypothetical protein OM95_16430 [Bdellovibrio sp. ArHS]|nr:MAG: hypothetical protein OM95_16430 [Bdellovibrio sp. ArHS]